MNRKHIKIIVRPSISQLSKTGRKITKSFTLICNTSAAIACMSYERNDSRLKSPVDWEGYNKKNNWILIGLLNDQHIISKILIVDDEGLGVYWKGKKRKWTVKRIVRQTTDRRRRTRGGRGERGWEMKQTQRRKRNKIKRRKEDVGWWYEEDVGGGEWGWGGGSDENKKW